VDNSSSVRLATASDLPALPALEDAADALFTQHGIGPLPPATIDAAAPGNTLVVFVVGEPVVGFATLNDVDGSAHLEQLSVHPAAARQGLGTALLSASIDWATTAGCQAMTLCTFAEVPWNAPFYARHGFAPLGTLSPGLASLRAQEQALGLDALCRRVVMRRDLSPAAQASPAAYRLSF
jgi:GNAT superfamily N-acetyltransferase